MGASVVSFLGNVALATGMSSLPLVFFASVEVRRKVVREVWSVLAAPSARISNT
jgi:hypothetical protein